MLEIIRIAVYAAAVPALLLGAYCAVSVVASRIEDGLVDQQEIGMSSFDSASSGEFLADLPKAA